METSILIILCVVFFAHWVADFIFQADEMAKGKSTYNFYLGSHVIVYSIIMLMITFPLSIFVEWITFEHVVVFAIFNGTVHFFVDYVTSRLSKKQWERGNIHNFFVIIGADQLIHILTLLISANLILF